MNGDRIEIKQNRITRRWRFNLVAGNNKAVTSSQRYATKDAALEGIKDTRRVAVLGDIVEVRG